MYDFSTDYNLTDKKIYQITMNFWWIKHNTKWYLGLSNWYLLLYQPCMARPTRIDLNLNKLCYYAYMVSLVRFNGSCNTLKDQSDILYALNKKTCEYKYIIW